jgi:carboxypeptidase C (cathepsin A)
MWWLISSLALSFATGSTAQFVQAPNDLTTAQGYAGIPVRYKQVPVGICEEDPRVKSFAGYSDVAPDQHIFWWFFEARTEPEKAPLTVWINGGPGFVPRPSLVCA